MASPHPIELVLCPTDLSEEADATARSAAALAREFGARLVLLHVAEPRFDYESYGLGEDTISGIREDLRKGILEQLERVKGLCDPDVSIETHMRRGVPAQEIITFAEKANVDLIVISTHGHSAVRHFLLGSVAERVLRSATCPVLTIRADQHMITS